MVVFSEKESVHGGQAKLFICPDISRKEIEGAGSTSVVQTAEVIGQKIPIIGGCGLQSARAIERAERKGSFFRGAVDI
jgi:hypothetical protein